MVPSTFDFKQGGRNKMKKKRIVFFVIAIIFSQFVNIYPQTQRRFFIKKQKPYSFSLFAGSVRGMGGLARIRIIKKINAEVMVGVSTFINSRYLSPYPGSIISFSSRLRYVFMKRTYLAGGFYTGVFNITEDIDLSQLIKTINGYSVSLGLRNFPFDKFNLELGAVFGIPERISSIVSEAGKPVLRVTANREPREISFLPLITIMYEL